MSQGQLLIVLGVALVGGAYLLYRSRKKAAAAQQQQQTSACPDGSAPDASGNCAQTGQDWSGAIATLQTEIADLQGAMAGAGAGASGGGGGGTGGPIPPVIQPNPPPIQPGGPPVPPPGGGGGFKPAGPVSGLQATATTTSGFTMRWNPASGATQGYAWGVRDLASHTQGPSGTTKATSVSVSGLKSGIDYNFAVQGLPGGPGANIHVRTK